MTDVAPNRWGEPMNHLEGTLALHGGEEVRPRSNPRVIVMFNAIYIGRLQ